ncbi:MAG: hypothetical protein GY827_07145 [Cytophagales bacterium]|nr:hypothetical protein [Cytophagales bacterium]
MKALIVVVFFTLLFSSCATHFGTMTGNASLKDENFKVIGLAIGTSSNTRVLGIGALKKEALVLQAKQNLYQNYPLEQGQALANVTVDFQRAYYPFFSKQRVTVSTEIIDFRKNIKVDTSVLDHSFTDSIFFSLKEEILFKKSSNTFLKGEILNVSRNTTLVRYLDKEQNIQSIRVSTKKVFKLSGESKNTLFSYNEKVCFLENTNILEGEIIALGENSVVVKLSKKQGKSLEISLNNNDVFMANKKVNNK